MLVQDGLRENSLRQPDKTALICGGRRLTYGELDNAANRLANALKDTGIGRSDRVAIFLPNRIEAVVAIFAALKCGAVFVVLNESAKPHKLAQILRDCEPAALVTSAIHAARGKIEWLRGRAAVICTGDPAECDREFLSYEWVQQSFPASRPAIDASDADLACLVYTSGSIGEPKAVMCRVI